MTRLALSSVWPLALAALVAGCSSSEPSRHSPGNVGRPPDAVNTCPCPDSSAADAHQNDTQPYNRVATLATVTFTTPFVLAGASWQKDDYLALHQDGLRDEVAFVGSYSVGGASVPPPESTSISVAVRNLVGFLDDPVPLAVLQRSLQEGQVVQPLVLMALAPESVETGVMAVTPQANSPVRVMLLEITEGTGYCVRAVGIGEINVTQAENLQVGEGGKLAFTGENIAMYYPSKTPSGDMTAQLGGVVCAE